MTFEKRKTFIGNVKTNQKLQNKAEGKPIKYMEMESLN